MDEQTPDKEFEATDYDESGNIKLLPPPLMAAKSKRLTVADLKKELDELKADVDDSVLGWLGELAVRLETLETTTATLNKTLIGDVKTRLDILDQGSLSDRQNVAEDIADRLDNQDAAIKALADALTANLMEAIATPQPPEPEIEFAQPHRQTDREQNMSYDITTMASTCQHMTDVLMICRVLKEAPDIPDMTKNDILHIACQNAGIDITGGLQIRAGVRNVEA